ncbi:arsenic resistance N-acetyltransferase ArsN2 [Halovenus marina]|uniref:arsenic resistance N-acetyltransferase ArsN2 n=1 Tax=Halovenus marina TaxID=3396621 RepID=UPI003F57A27B
MTERTTARSISIERAQGRLDSVETVLEANGLPTADIGTSPVEFFLAVDGEKPVGVGGIERHGPDGLLRSLAVRESHREQGYGTRLCSVLETHARTNGVETLYLLTTTAAAFFRRREYEEVSRQDVPPQIRQTREFSDLCPAAATCLKRSLRTP